MLEQRKVMRWMAIMLVISFVLAILAEYIKMSHAVIVLSGHRNFWVGIFLGIFTGASIGTVTSYIAYTAKKTENVAMLIEMMLDLKAYLSNFSSIKIVDDQCMKNLYAIKYDEWYENIMHICTKINGVTDLFSFGSKKEKELLLEISQYLDKIYKDANRFRDNNRMVDIIGNKDHIELKGEKDYIEEHKYLEQCNELIDKITKTYRIKMSKN